MGYSSIEGMSLQACKIMTGSYDATEVVRGGRAFGGAWLVKCFEGESFVFSRRLYQ
jgi:hypothetical protein